MDMQLGKVGAGADETETVEQRPVSGAWVMERRWKRQPSVPQPRQEAGRQVDSRFIKVVLVSRVLRRRIEHHDGNLRPLAGGDWIPASRGSRLRTPETGCCPDA